MSQNGQKSTNPADYQHVPRAVAAMPKDFPQDFVIEPHSHERAQLIYAPAGTMPLACRVLQVSPLLRELIVRATELPLQYDEDGPAGRVIALLLDELHGSPA